MRGLAETQKKKKQTASKAAAETCIHLADNYHTHLTHNSHITRKDISQTFIRTDIRPHRITHVSQTIITHNSQRHLTDTCLTPRRHSSAQNHTHLAKTSHRHLESQRFEKNSTSTGSLLIQSERSLSIKRRTQRQLVILLEESFFIKSSYNFYL